MAPITLSVNGAVKQSADRSDLVWPVTDIIAFLSQLYRLEPSDLVYTGTPAGVGPVVPEDEMVATIGGLEPLRIRVGEQAA